MTIDNFVKAIKVKLCYFLSSIIENFSDIPPKSQINCQIFLSIGC